MKQGHRELTLLCGKSRSGTVDCGCSDARKSATSVVRFSCFLPASSYRMTVATVTQILFPFHFLAFCSTSITLHRLYLGKGVFYSVIETGKSSITGKIKLNYPGILFLLKICALFKHTCRNISYNIPEHYYIKCKTRRAFCTIQSVNQYYKKEAIQNEISLTSLTYSR